MVHRMRRSTPPTRRARTRPSSLDPSAFRPTPIGWPASGDGLPAGRDHGRRRAAPSPIPVRIFGRGRGSRCCGCLRRRRRAPPVRSPSVRPTRDTRPLNGSHSGRWGPRLTRQRHSRVCRRKYGAGRRPTMRYRAESLATQATRTIVRAESQPLSIRSVAQTAGEDVTGSANASSAGRSIGSLACPSRCRRALRNAYRTMPPRMTTRAW